MPASFLAPCREKNKYYLGTSYIVIPVGVYLVFITHVRDHFEADTASMSSFFADVSCFGVCIYVFIYVGT